MYQLSLKFFKNKVTHQFHLVDASQLPFIIAMTAMLLVMSFVFHFHPFLLELFGNDRKIFHLCAFGIALTLFAWFLWVLYESGQGHHTWVVRNGLRFGMFLFIVSEIMFFFAFFWAFFHVSLAPAIAIGSIWPPKSLQFINAWGLPLLNTILLLSSGITITYSHHALLTAITYTIYKFFSKHLGATVALGAIFLCCQGLEYKLGIFFQWKESVFGSTFFVTTGFHGFHVTLGTIFLLFCLLRGLLTSPRDKFVLKNFFLIIPVSQNVWAWILEVFGTKNILENSSVNKEKNMLQNWFAKFSFRKNQHIGFESSAWYWHFVDVVWIFLFITVYWWGTSS